MANQLSYGRVLITIALLSVFLVTPTRGDWPSWRGPSQNGVGHDTGLISEWSPDGKNLLWRTDFIGRSTPVVLDGRVYVLGRVGRDITEQERVASFDAGTGELIWEHRFNLFHTTIPFNRVGWANPAGDPETGYIYAHGVQGIFFCFDRDGNIVWSRSLTEEYGRIAGYGGRVHSPVVVGDLVVISFLNVSWGAHTVPRHRYFAFDKTTGDVAWTSTPGGRPLDTTYSVPVIAYINGQQLLIGGNADGGIYAMKASTGEKVWGFKLSQRGINSSVVVQGNLVYAAHSEENLDTTAMGRVVCIDGTGSGDVTATHEVWRYDGCAVGYTSPVVHDGDLFVVDNSANLHCLDAATGTSRWDYSLGTVGKGSPVWADGKIYATEVNGGFHIVDVSAAGATKKDADRILVAGENRPAEIYGSPAIDRGRIYFSTEEGLYCLGDGPAAPSMEKPAGAPAQPAVGKAAHLQVVPTELLTFPGQKVTFEARAFDANGNPLGAVPASWSLENITGSQNDKGRLKLDGKVGGQAGTVRATFEGLEANARVRSVPELPWTEDFEAIEAGKNPPYWIAAGSKFKVATQDGNNILVKPPSPRGLHRSNVYLGASNMSGYTIQVDLLGTKNKRRRPDMGLINQRYTLDMMGNHQRLQIRSWASDLRMAKTINFSWDPDVWYTVKMCVDVEDDRALVHGKVWRRGDPEPASWTLTAEDPLPNRSGSPGIYGYSAADIQYDNLKVWENESQ